MKIVTELSILNETIAALKKSKSTIGFVPTMGYFHEGHLSLMRQAKIENDFVVVSIFVNPTQFGPNEDFESYPRDLNRDLELCKAQGVDVVFAPTVEEMYPEGYGTYIDCEGSITKGLCGEKRPGHFKGVTTIVGKLFNLVLPDKAYFGQKDAQQVAVIEKMVRDLNFPITIVPCAIVREPDGLAMSSRNVYLNEEERAQALVLHQSLVLAKKRIDLGEKSAKIIEAMIYEHIKSAKNAAVDYIAVVNAVTLEKVEHLEGDVLIALAVKFGKTRLIDNVRIKAVDA